MSEDPEKYNTLGMPWPSAADKEQWARESAKSLEQGERLQIRIEALRAAAMVVGNMPTDYIEMLDYEKATLAAAERFAEWLETGK